MRFYAQKLKLVAGKSLLLLLVATPILVTGIAGKLFVNNQALAATSNTINFQARLMNAAGAIAPDGDYNVEFKLYNTSSTGGTAQGVCTGNCQWVETRTGGNKVHVANGYLTVQLGSVTGFGTSINWDQQLWITMNIGGTGTPTWDGEMTPRLQLTAVPYAFRAGQLASLAGSNTAVLQFAASFGQATTITLPDPGASTATVCYQNSSSCGFVSGTSTNFIQNGTSVQTAANFNIRSAAAGSVVAVIQGTTGQSADLLDVQTWNGTTNTTVFGVGANGQVTLGGGLTPDITTATAATANGITLQPGVSSGASTTGAGTTIKAGDVSGTTSVTGGTLALQGGSATGGSGTRNGGSVTIDAGTGATTAGNITIGGTAAATVSLGSTTLATGTQTINVGANNTSGSTTNVTVGSGSSATAGSTTVRAHDAVTITAGAASTWSTTSGLLTLQGNGGVTINTPNSTSAATNGITIKSGDASTGANLNAGTILIDTGTQTGSGTAAINVGTTNGRAIGIGNTGSNAVVTIQGGGGVNVGTGGVTGGVQIGNTTGGVAQTISIGTNATTSATNTVNIGTTSTSASVININSGTGSGNSINLKGNNATGGVFVQSLTNSTNAFKVQDAGTNVYLGIDTSGASISVGYASSTTTLLGTVKVSTLGAATANSASVCRDTSTNALTSCDTNTTGKPYVQGGNSFGAAGDLGTNDANALNIRTGGTTRLTVGASGGVSLASGNGLTVTAGATSLTGATSGDALTVSNSTSTGNIAIFNDNATAVATIADGGGVLLQNSVDSSTAFQVKTSASGTNAALLGVDTSSSILNVGAVGSTAVASTVNVGTSTGATQTVNIGGTSGSTANGTTVVIQGGNTSSAVNLQALASGTINIGTNNAANTVQIGSTSLSSGTQVINIGNNNTSGGTTNITIGTGSSATGGTTTVQAKTSLTLTTNGVGRVFLDNTATMYLGGNAATVASPNDYTIQGAGTSTAATAGAAVKIQGGTGNTTGAGGKVTLQGGTAGGSGVKGLIELNGGTYFTTGSFSNGSSATITQSLVDSNSAILASATAGSLTFTVPTPTNGASQAGRLLYIINSGSNAFTLSFASTSFTLNPGATATLVYTGSAWTGAGADASSLQNAYNNSTGSTTPEVLLDTTRRGLDVQDANTTLGSTEALLAVRASATASTLGNGLFVVNAGGKVGINLASNSTTPTISNDLSFGQIAGATTARTIGVEAQTSSNIGGNGLTATAGTGNGTGNGGVLTLQGGTSGTGAAAIGGQVTIQGGTANGSGASNGGKVTIQGGTAAGTGVKGLIELNGGTFFTTASFSSGSSGNITQSFIDSNSAILASATAGSLTFTVPTPTNGASQAGRVLYITNSGANAFTLSFASTSFTLNVGSTATLMYNGSAWTSAGVDASSLQNAYTNSTGGTTAEMILDNTRKAVDIQDANGGYVGSNAQLLAVRTGASSGLGNPLLTVTNSGGNSGTALVGVGIETATRTLDVAVNTSSINTLPLLLEQAGTGDVGLELKNSSKNFYLAVDGTDGVFKIASATSANGTTNSGDTSGPPTDANTDSNASATSAQLVTAGATGSVSSVSFYITSVAASPNNHIQAAIYANSTTCNVNGATVTTTPCPGTLLGSSAQVVATTGWNTISISGVNVTSGTSYWIALAEDGVSPWAQLLQAGIGTVSYDETSSYPAPSAFGQNYHDVNTRNAFYMTIANTGATDNFGGTPFFQLTDTGAFTLQNAVNSTGALRVQNAAGTTLLGVDTTNSTLNMGVVGSAAQTGTVNIGTSTGATQTVNIGGTSGSTSNGTTVMIQGGNTSSAVSIQSLASGTIAIGNNNAANTLQIGSTTLSSGTQTIAIGNNNTSGGTTNITIGTGSSATGGTTTVQAKGAVTITAGATSTWSTSAGNLTIQSGAGSGTLNLNGGAATGATTGGTATLQGGAASATAGSNGGGVSILGAVGSTTGTGGTGGTILLSAGNAGGSGNNAGGNITLNLGGATGTGTSGSFFVQNSVGANLLTLDPSNTNGGNNLISNGGAETGSPPTGYTAQGTGASVATGTGTDAASGSQSVKATFGTNANSGVKASFSTAPTASTTVNYIVSFSAKLVSGTAMSNTLQVVYSPDNGTTLTATCSNYSSQGLSTTAWTKISCSFVPGSTTVTTAQLYIRQTDAPGVSRVIDIDNLSVVQQNSSGTSNVGDLKVGGALSQGLTLLTLDTYASTPFTGSNSSLAGSMYFDTTSGKIQCYDGSSWGACGAAPNGIVTLTPEYAGAVLNGSGIGTMTSDFCANSGALTVGTLCGTNDARNFYKWTSPQGTAQAYSIYVTYKLPPTFKAFVSGSTSLTGLVDNTTNATVKYAIFKSTGSAISSCSALSTVVGWNGSSAVGTANAWTSGVAGTLSGTTDPSTCGFAAGNNVIFQIQVSANSNAAAYAENLNFQYSNQ